MMTVTMLVVVMMMIMMKLANRGLPFLFANMFSILVETYCPDHNEPNDDNVGPWVVMMMIMMIGKPGLGFLFENMFSI